MHITEGADISPLDNQQSTMERIAAHIPGTTEYEAFSPTKSIWVHLILGTLSVTTPVSFARDMEVLAT